MKTLAKPNQVSWLDWSLAAAIGLGLSLLVWWGLVAGGGLVGGDTFTYFLPQKLVLAEAYSNGETPLWHSLTGLGYPLLAESQAGVFYPPHQLLYRITDVNSAYNACVVLHYWLAFVFAWRFCRCQNLTNIGAFFAATIFVYGWFPARISHEWSIVGGVWFPLTLWLADRLVAQPSLRRLAVLSLCLATHLLAGHFTLAFINQLTILAYAGLKVWMSEPNGNRLRRTLTATALTGLAVLLAMGAAAVQLVPTYELKLASQREAKDAGDNQKPTFDPAYGHMPPVYATQVFASWWYWHSPEVLLSRKMMDTPGAIYSDSNHVEAHLYWGLIPLALMLCLMNSGVRTRTHRLPRQLWSILLVAALVYATGWMMPLSKHLPGFGFFNGPGRYTIVCSLAGGILAGLVLDAFISRWRTASKWLLLAVLISVTIPDLLMSSRYVADAVVVPESPLNKLDKSWIKQYFANSNSSEHRLLAPGPNVANLYGVSCLPVYLGLGPAVYFDDRLNPATGPQNNDEAFPAPAEAQQLNELGITHILTTEAIQQPTSAIKLLQQFPDALLNAIWGRGSQPCFLYELTECSGRILSEPAEALSEHAFHNVGTNDVTFSVTMADEADVVLKELMYPGWDVFIDGRLAPVVAGVGPSMRCVRVPSGQHVVQWRFQPTSFRTGKWVTAVFAVLLCVMLGNPWCKSSQSNASLKAEI